MSDSIRQGSEQDLPVAQLTLDGREVSMDSVAALPGVNIGPTARAILSIVARNGFVTATDAGLIVHRDRPPNHGAYDKERRKRPSRQCCAYCSTDGTAAIKRMREAGLLARNPDGEGWVSPQ